MAPSSYGWRAGVGGLGIGIGEAEMSPSPWSQKEL